MEDVVLTPAIGIKKVAQRARLPPIRSTAARDTSPLTPSACP